MPEYLHLVVEIKAEMTITRGCVCYHHKKGTRIFQAFF